MEAATSESEVIAVLRREEVRLRKGRTSCRALLTGFVLSALAFGFWQARDLLPGGSNQIDSSASYDGRSDTSRGTTGIRESVRPEKPEEHKSYAGTLLQTVAGEHGEFGVFALGLADLPHRIHWPVMTLLIAASGATLAGTLRGIRTQKRAAGALAQLDTIQAIGPLAEALRIDDSRIRRLAETALSPLLIRLQSSDSGILNSAQRDSLNKSLTSRNMEYVLALLKALEQVGDATSLPQVRRMAESTHTRPQVADAARSCLPFLLMRIEQTRAASTLLRPAMPTKSDSTLLRPIQFTHTSDSGALLRPTDE